MTRSRAELRAFLGISTARVAPLAAFGLWLTALSAPTAHADTPAAQPSSLETIIVTAEKRPEDLQNVPASITALTGDTLQQMGATDFESFDRTIPGLSANEGVPGRTDFIIRGIGTANTPGNTQATVGTYIDDLPTMDSFGAPLTPDMNLFDAERVEVLRGPQGTLFGSGSIGGAIRIITAKPDLDGFFGKVEATAADTHFGADSYGLNAMINAPLIAQEAAIRVVAYDRLDGGYVDNTATGRSNQNGVRTSGGRAELRVQPSEPLTITATAIYQKQSPNDSSLVFTAPNSLQYDNLVANTNKSEFGIYNLVAEYNLGWAHAISSSSYANVTSRVTVDATSTVAPLFAEFGAPGPAAPYYLNDFSHFFTEEIRLSSVEGARVNWLIGGFFLDRWRHDKIDLVAPGAGALLGAFGFPSDTLYSTALDLPGREAAGFGEISYALIPTLTATAGIRVFHNVSTYGAATDGFLNGGASASRDTTSNGSSTPKFSLAWKPDSHVMVYALAAEGYRVGQNNPAIPPDPVTGAARGLPYGPDSLWNYEIGVKSTWFDRRLSLNGDVYHIDWTNIQLDQTTTDGFNYIANGGKAHSQGLELELDARPTDHVELSSGVAYTDARLDSDAPGLGAVKGARLPGSPDFMITSTAQYDFDVSGHRAFVRAEYQYIGTENATPSALTNVKYGDYSVVNLRASMRFKSWEAVIFANNLADDRGVVTAQPPAVIRLRPRTVGLTLRTTF